MSTIKSCKPIIPAYYKGEGSNFLTKCLPREELIKDTRAYIAARDKFLEGGAEEHLPIGAQVRHAVLGPGEILDADEKKNAYLIQFTDLDTPRAIAFREKLERV